MFYQLSRNDRKITGTIALDGSKSISNRVLIIAALCGENVRIDHLSNSRDTQTLKKLLHSKESVLDAGNAGTTFRFMTAYLGLQGGTQVLTGSQRMKLRPIGILVDALRQLGASIEYLEKEGFPPLKIGAPQIGDTNFLTVSAHISSQFISALLMIAPALPNGLKLQLSNKVVSQPYIEMTLKLMAFFGIQYEWKDDLISIPPQKYKAGNFTVEADWSAASYFYALTAFADEVDLYLTNLWQNSVQGDSVIVQIMDQFGIATTYTDNGIRLRKSGKPVCKSFEWDFTTCPDLAQTMAVVCAGFGTKGIFNGLETLRLKETDRIAALQAELEKLKVTFSGKPETDRYSLTGVAQLNFPRIQTYDDHRMAMAFAPLALFDDILIEDPYVVEKSYPKFWDDLLKLGFDISEVK